MSKVTEISRRRFVGSALSAAALAPLPARSMADAKMQKMGGDEMTSLTPYLLFEGKCQQAMEFYKSCFGGELTATKVKDSPAKDFMPAVQQEKILNARLRSGKLEMTLGLPTFVGSDITALMGEARGNLGLYTTLPFFQHLLQVSGFTAEAEKADAEFQRLRGKSSEHIAPQTIFTPDQVTKQEVDPNAAQ